MPGLPTKQVRFAYQNLFHSPPPTPALSFCSSTMSSDSGPVTPPYPTQPLPAPSNYSPYKRVRAVSLSEPIRLHPILRTGALTWDMLDHPTTARYNHSTISHRALLERATSPGLPYIKITSIHLLWPIRIYATNGSYVTVDDVLDGIYHSLRTNITESEFNSLPTSSDRRRATQAYEKRYRRLGSAREYDNEKKGGMKRIDFFMGHSRFLGLSSNSYRSDEWRLHIS